MDKTEDPNDIYLLYLWLNNQPDRSDPLDIVRHSPIIVPDDDVLSIPDSPALKKQTWDEPGSKDVVSYPSRPEPEPGAPRDSVVAGAQPQEPVGSGTWDKFLDHIIKREGYENTVYKDSLGKPTVGVGHLVRSGDGLKVGDRISDEQVHAFLETDARTAYLAAIEQANELGINDSDFVVSLASVNYQLGTGWRSEFKNTWGLMKEGDFEQAAKNVGVSLWARQTPVRTDDFQTALRNVDHGFQVASLSPVFTDSATGDSATKEPDPDIATKEPDPDIATKENTGPVDPQYTTYS